MPTVAANGIEISYERRGDPSGTPLLMIHGLGAQMTDWDDRFLDLVVEAGFHVIIFDNRDAGESTWFDEAGEPDLVALLMEGVGEPPYLVADMAADAAALLDALDLGSVHVLGVSMGGMIAQQFAIDHGHRVLTLTSIMSTPHILTVGQPTDEALVSLMAPPAATRQEAIDQMLFTGRFISSPAYAFDEEFHQGRAAQHYDRGYHPVGTARQTAAIMASPDRTEALRAITTPTLVIHGDADPLVTLPGGHATASAVEGSELWVIEGMGHDLPQALWPQLIERLSAHTGV
jgi:hypothetical protein